MLPNFQSESAQKRLPSFRVCAVEKRGKVTPMLTPPPSPVKMITVTYSSLQFICTESLNRFRWRHITADTSRKDIYHMNWKLADTEMDVTDADGLRQQ